MRAIKRRRDGNDENRTYFPRSPKSIIIIIPSMHGTRTRGGEISCLSGFYNSNLSRKNQFFRRRRRRSLRSWVLTPKGNDLTRSRRIMMATTTTIMTMKLE